MASETTLLLGPPAASAASAASAAPAAPAASPGPLLRGFSEWPRNLGVEESKGGEREDETPVGAGAGAGAAAPVISTPAPTEEECYARPKNDTIETWFTTNNPDPRLFPYKEAISTLYEIVTCLNGREPNFVINNTHTLEVMKDIFKNIEKLNIFNIIKKKFTGYTPDQTAILVGLFTKLFNQQHNAPSWPPENYPEDKMPPLYSIKGFQAESFLDATIRQIAAIKVEGKSNIKEVYDHIVELKKTNPAQLSEIVERFCKPEWDKYNTLMPDKRTFYFNRDPSAQRLISNLLPQWYDYIYGALDSTCFTELEFVSYRGQVHHTHMFKKKSMNRNQQIFFILPSTVNPATYKIYDIDVQNEYMATMAALNKPNINIEDKDSIFWPNVTNFQWIQVDSALRAPLNEREIYQYQGYRLTHFPHPEVLLAIAHGVKGMTPHMHSLFPEWGTKETRQKWVLEALKTWNRDIEAMTDPDQKYVQRYLYNDVLPKIQTVFGGFESKIEKLPRIDANIKRLAANANTTDPNAMFDRVQNFQQSYASVLAPLKAAGSITELQERNKGKRWYGAAIEPKEAYRAKIKSYIAQIQQALGGPSAVSTEVDMILKLARMPKPNTRDLYARFDAWRRTLDYSKIPVDLANRIREIRPAGFFTGATGYAAKIAELVLATQQTGPQVVAGAVLDTTLTTISSGVRALEQDIDALPRDAQTTEMSRVVHDIPSYTKGSMDPRVYLVRVFEGLKRAYDMFGRWRSSGPSLGAGAGAGAAAHVGGRRRTAKTSAKNKGMTRSRKHTRKAQRPPKGGRYDAPHAAQRGGASMPLAYYQDGAQMRGTYADPTGVGLAGSTSTMARTGISQTGGRRRSRHQNGGFAPSIMGQMVANGAYLAPVASYMGYRLLKGSRGPRSTQKKRRSLRRR